jgi:hypothetical protein
MMKREKKSWDSFDMGTPRDLWDLWQFHPKGRWVAIGESRYLFWEGPGSGVLWSYSELIVCSINLAVGA